MPTPMTLPMDSPTLPIDLPEKNGRAHVTGDPDPDPSLSDSSSKKYLIYRMTKIHVNKIKRNAIIRKSIRNTKKRTCQAHR